MNKLAFRLTVVSILILCVICLLKMAFYQPTYEYGIDPTQDCEAVKKGEGYAPCMNNLSRQGWEPIDTVGGQYVIYRRAK